MSIFKEWLDAKEAERQATEARRLLEDQMIKSLDLPEYGESSQTIKRDGYKIKVTYRMNRSINAEALQEIAAETGLTEHLASLFRWKPEINAKAWKDAAPEITTPLLDAITTKPGRPSFAVEANDAK